MRLYVDPKNKPSDYYVQAIDSAGVLAVLRTGLVTHVSFSADVGGHELIEEIEVLAANKVIPRFTWEVHSEDRWGRVQRRLKEVDRAFGVL